MQKHFNSLSISAFLVLSLSVFLEPAYAFKINVWAYVSLIFPVSVVLRIVFLREREDILFFTAIFLTWLNFSQPYIKPEPVTHLYRIIPTDYLEAMSFFSGLSVVALYIGYYGSFRKKKVKPIFKTDAVFDSKTIGYFMLVVMTLYITYLLMKELVPSVMRSLGSILAILQYSPSLISAGLTLMLIRRRSNLLTVVILIAFLVFQFLIAVAETLFIYVILIAFVPFLIYIFEKKRIPVLAIVGVSILLMPIFTLRHYFRKEAFKWWYSGEKVTRTFLAKRGIDVIEETYTDRNIFDTSDKIKEEDNGNAERFEQVSYLGQCVYQHEVHDWSYLYGKTFWWLPLAPIPRFLIPFKPQNKMGTKMAEDYGLKGKTGGAMNWPMLVEYYVNFGFLGMLFFSFLQGLSYRFLYSLLAFGKGDLNMIALFSLILPVIKIESNVTLIYGQIIQFILLWYVLSITIFKNFKSA